MQDKIEELHQRRASLASAGGEQRVAKQHEQGKMTARERIDALLDPKSPHHGGQARIEIGAFAADGMYAEHGGARRDDR